MQPTNTRKLSLRREEERHSITGVENSGNEQGETKPNAPFLTTNAKPSTSKSDSGLVVLKSYDEIESIDNFIPTPGLQTTDGITEVADLNEMNSSEESKYTCTVYGVPGEHFETGEWFESNSDENGSSGITSQSNSGSERNQIKNLKIGMKDFKAKYGAVFTGTLEYFNEAFNIRKDFVNRLNRTVGSVEDLTRIRFNAPELPASYSFNYKLLGTRSLSDEAMQVTNWGDADKVTETNNGTQTINKPSNSIRIQNDTIKEESEPEPDIDEGV